MTAPEWTADPEVISERVHSAIRAGNEFLVYAIATTKSPGEAIMGLLFAARSICENVQTDPPVSAFDAFVHAVSELPSHVFQSGKGASS